MLHDSVASGLLGLFVKLAVELIRWSSFFIGKCKSSEAVDLHCVDETEEFVHVLFCLSRESDEKCCPDVYFRDPLSEHVDSCPDGRTGRLPSHAVKHVV